MKAIIYITISEHIQNRYFIPLLRWAKEEIRDLSTLDLDSQSEGVMVQYATEMVKQATKIVVIIESLDDISSAPVLKMMDMLSRQKEKSIMIIQIGENQMVEKMALGLKNGVLIKEKGEARQKELIKEFFQTV